MFFKKAVLVIHGFAGGTYDVEFISNNLQFDPLFDVFTFTLPGHDKLTLSKVTKDDWVKSCEVMIEKLISAGYKNIYVVGHSMGCILAGHLAVKYKEVKKVVMMSPAYNYFTFKGNEFSLKKGIKDSTEIFKKMKGYEASTLFSRMIKAPYVAIQNFVDLVNIHYNDPLSITCPILIIHGTSDKIAPYSSSKYVYDSVKSKICILYKANGATHDLSDYHKKEDIINYVHSFLKGSYNYIGKDIIGD